ncbi:MAG: metallophosphoesterase [Mogibacterium sp.]|nr:metallophosphoesterase [Mogibacterium sp.]
MKVLVIPDVHLKPRLFDRASALLDVGVAEQAVCLMDLPDSWGQGMNIDLYLETFDAAIRFAKKHPETLWCYGNHDLSYVWRQPESGFSNYAIMPVNHKLRALRKALPDAGQMAYIHRIDDVLFMHGGLTRRFVEYFVPDLLYDNTDEVIRIINELGSIEMWEDDSPIWYRPQFYSEEMYREEDMLQVVGHTPVTGIERDGNVISCDLFSTYRSGEPIGTQEYLLIETETWKYRGVK